MTKRPAPLGSSQYRIQVLDRSLGILDVLAAVNESLSAAELGRRLSLHKSTLHRILMVLEQHRFVHRDRKHGQYSLGVKLFELGSRAVQRLDIRDCSEPILRRLVDATRETAHVCILDGTETVSIANVEGPWAMRGPSTVGRRTPLYCTSVGKAVMAFLPDAAVDQLIERLTFKQFTPRTIVTPAALRAELRRVRERGFAVDDEEVEKGLRCVGAPVRNHTGGAIAAISIVGPAFRLVDQCLPAIARAVMSAARDLSREMGYSGQTGRLQERRKEPSLNDAPRRARTRRHPAVLGDSR
jgi:DNA-binding IclR family transcriptional regulator